MALEGTFKDFGLAEIFQLIGLQKKTGVLTVRGEGEQVVTVFFEKGMVVFADEYQRSESERLGSVLLRTQRITSEDLAQAIEKQEQTLQRLGYVLVNSNLITQEELSQALQVQLKETVYRLFRWKEGNYHFSPEPVSYDKEIYSAVPAEFILLEGIRMIDEWPIIEKKITSYQMVFEKVPGMEPPPAPEQKEKFQEEDWDDLISIVEEEGAPLAGSETVSEEGRSTLSPQDQVIYRLVDGERTVQDLVDIGQLGEFETCKILYGFLSLNLIREKEEVQREVVPEAVPRRRYWPWGEFWVVAAFGAAIFLGLLFNPWNFFSLSYQAQRGREEIAALKDEVKLQRLHQALKAFYLEKQTYPSSLEKLREDGLLRAAELRDHRGHPFAYQVGEKNYLLGLASK